jgi:predicted membrane-bound spermidine synthase
MTGRDDRFRQLAFRILAFSSGLGILVLEVAGARLIADTYGLSSIPWTAVIAAVLTGFAAGNLLGGRAADRRAVSLFALFLGAGAYVAVPVLGIELPALLQSRLGFLGGAVAAAAVFFVIPATLMGAVTPVLVTHQTREVAEAGATFGDVGAWGTAGAIAGTLVGGFVLLPAFGLASIFAAVAVLFLLCSSLAAGVEGMPRGTAVGLLLAPAGAALALGPGWVGTPAVFAGQSLHSSLRVVDSSWPGGRPVRELWQNGSLSSAEDRVTGEPVHLYQILQGALLADRVGRIGSVLQLGGAANTFPAHLKRTSPHLDITVVEIDPMAVRVAAQYFSFGRLPPGALTVVVQDARPFLRSDRGSYDVVLSDAYDHLYSVPWPLMTLEALRDMEARLTDGGMLGLTISTALQGPGAAFLHRLVATLDEVFRAVRVYVSRPDVEGTFTQEVVVVAVRDEGDFPEGDAPWRAIEGSGPPFRDDFAPVEFLQALRFFADPEW